MAKFTIDADNNITVHVGLPAGTDPSQSFSTAKELDKLTAEWPVSRLVETWNSFVGAIPFDDLKPVKKFTNRKGAVTRLSPDVAAVTGKAKKSPAKAPARRRAKQDATESTSNKKAEVIAMMKRANGATLTEIIEATGWQKHTVRGFVSILGNKGGQKIESSKNPDGERSYRIAK